MANSSSKKGVLFSRCRLIDGTGADPQTDRAILVQGDRISKIAGMAEITQQDRDAYREIDLQGMTLLPGLIEAHFHISYWGVKELPDLDLRLPPEECTIYATRNAELILRCGYTSVCSAGSLHRVDVALRDLIDNRVIPGPRMLASGRDLCPTGGMLDWNPSYWKLGMDGLAVFADGCDEVRKGVRSIIREQADVVKVFVTGEGLLRPWSPPEETMMSYDEIAVAVEEAHRGRMVMAHVRSAHGVKLCVKAGVDIIHHATLSDDEAIELLAKERDRVFVVPALGYTWATAYKAVDYGVPPDVVEKSGSREEYEHGCKVMAKLKEAGVRVLPGGDYGFVWCPHGQEAKDLELFVRDVGFSPMETIVSATKWGSEIMRMPAEIGTVEEGKLADLLVVSGDPLTDITLFQDRGNIQLVMKGGVVMCNRLGLPQVLTDEYSMDEHVERVATTEGWVPGYREQPKEAPQSNERIHGVEHLIART